MGGRPVEELGAIVVLLGDLHPNSTTGLMPPRVQLDDGLVVSPSERQLWIWSHWRDLWAQVAQDKERTGWPVWAFLNGELVDINHHKTTQLITRNEVDAFKLALACLRPAIDLVDQFVVLRGTEAHVGPSASYDEQLARDLAKEAPVMREPTTGAYSWWRWYGHVGGVTFDVQHHPGTSSRVPNTRGNEANKLAMRIFYEYAEVNHRLLKAGEAAIPWPDLVVRGHNHRPGDSADNHPVRAIILPSWQLPTAFGYKVGGDLLPIGGGIAYCRNGRLNLAKHYHSETPSPIIGTL